MFIFPTVEKIEKGSRRIIETQRESLRLVTQTMELTKFEESLDQYQPDLDRIDSLFIDSHSPLTFIQFLETTSLETNTELEISSIITPTTETNNWIPLTFNIILDGSFNDVMKFLEKVELSDYLVQSENLIMALDLDEEVIRMTLSLKLLTQ
ncbi:MAG: hypothetical protein KY054_00935 [Candidatus Nealsonbacteria bacterium]|nr:hypothetical protein [Candidatus Nealsonbacteria bacterium]